MALTGEDDAMQVEIRARNIEVDEALGIYVDRRLRFALGRFGHRIAKVTVRFHDANGPRGGMDKQCQIEVSLRPCGIVLVEDIADDVYAVVDRAADRIGRAVERDIHRRREASLL